MPRKTFLKAEEVASDLGVSLAYAYKLIKKLNNELDKQGFITINGRINRQYFTEKLYGKEVHDERL